ncbi:DUF1269 domain-containing protein [Ramlibacter sp. Leaf400]|uniref:DUF1269 domain-containing protein n=1 Tax=Ramlibacter sp. Leaf400 TaxID=1736365 RepID=UPI00070153E6|nr:DUF1269 domain-containing protein [Ramlibacter sp. Leaf400]KQT08060.1 hypothetical protein ASG30_16660 [Ramlibacter sp. Leaf400]
MTTRIYWLLPDVESAQDTMDDLLLAHVEYRHMHFVGREDLDMKDLNRANVMQTSDVVRSAEMGLILGASLGALIGGLVAVFYPIVGDKPQWGVAVGLAIAGALFGVWTSTMIGVSTPSKRLKRFAPQIEQGQVLLMLDLPRLRVDEITARLQKRHPEAHFEGREAETPAFP